MGDMVEELVELFVFALVGAALTYALGAVVLSLAVSQPWYAQYGWPIVGAFAGFVVYKIKSKKG